MAERQASENKANESDAWHCCVCGQLPEKPWLLSCLHSCCPGCAAEAVTGAGRGGGDVAHVYCRLCKQETKVVERGLHSLVMQTSSLDISKALPVCEFCPEKAEHWCLDCAKHLCGTCKLSHDKFLSGHKSITLAMPGESVRAAVGSLPADDARRRTRALSCPQHGRPFDHVCSTCGGALKCVTCGEVCTRSRHEIHILIDGDVSHAKEEVASLANSLRASESVLKCRRLALRQEFEADAQELKARKRDIATVLEEAFGAAYDELKESYDEAMARPEQLTERVERALERCESLMECTDEPTNLLTQCRHVKHRLQWLLDEARGAQVHGMGSAAPRVDVSAEPLPDDLLETMIRWIGRPKVGCTGSLSSTNASIDIMCPCSSIARDQAPQRQWRDVAVTCCGHVLLAAGQRGLEEYDARGRPLSHWPAPVVRAQEAAVAGDEKREEVITVDSLEDDRAVVGLKFAKTAVLLDRSAGAHANAWSVWQELRRFDIGESLPFALAACSARLVVACGSLGDCDRLSPGSELISLMLADGQRQRQAQLKFAVYGLAVTESFVVVASYGKVKVDAAPEQYVVKSFDHDLQQVRWLIKFDTRVWDVASSPSGRVLYATVTDYSAGSLTAIKADDGSTLAIEVSFPSNAAAAASTGRGTAVASGGSSGMVDGGGGCCSVSDDSSIAGGAMAIGSGSSASSCSSSSSSGVTLNYHQLKLPTRLSVDKVGNCSLATLSLDSKTVSLVDAHFLSSMESEWLSVRQSV